MREEVVTRSLEKKLSRSLRRSYPHLIEDVRFQLGADSDGDSAVFVTVVLKDLVGASAA
jgi:hypothetical protein